MHRHTQASGFRDFETSSLTRTHMHAHSHTTAGGADKLKSAIDDGAERVFGKAFGIGDGDGTS